MLQIDSGGQIDLVIRAVMNNNHVIYKQTQFFPKFGDLKMFQKHTLDRNCGSISIPIWFELTRADQWNHQNCPKLKKKTKSSRTNQNNG